MTSRSTVRFAALATAAALVLQGCQSTGGALGGADDPCNPLLGGLVGAALGAVVTSGNNRVRGAAVGTAVGALACIAVNVATKQTRSSREVEEEYRKKNAGQLPRGEPVLQDYAMSVTPAAAVKPGEAIQVVSQMTVVSGNAEPVREVKEVLSLTGPQGTRTAEKVANEKPGSGAFENSFRLSFPKDVTAGTYPVRTQVYVNGKLAGERQRDVTLVAEGDHVRVASVR
jgi:hypothetical protein